jgi:hypothetical protein
MKVVMAFVGGCMLLAGASGLAIAACKHKAAEVGVCDAAPGEGGTECNARGNGFRDCAGENNAAIVRHYNTDLYMATEEANNRDVSPLASEDCWRVFYCEWDPEEDTCDEYADPNNPHKAPKLTTVNCRVSN